MNTQKPQLNPTLKLVLDIGPLLLFFIANQTPLTQNVNANDVPLRDVFPYLAPPQQPRATGTIDDNTRN